jgi:CelD/BcsL family acetyltransferase involved in cellulose biosynthesis
VTPAETIELEPEDPRWTSFAQSQPEATPFHHPAWARLLADCYGFRAFCLAVTDGEAVRAGIPALEVKRPLGPRRWVSLPFTDRCPPLAGALGADDLAVALDTKRKQAGISELQVRGALDGHRGHAAPAGLVHVLELDPDPEVVYGKFSRSQVHRNIRRAEKEGVTVRRATAREELVETYYGLHLDTRRRLGVPVQPRRMFDLIWDRMVEPGLGFAVLAFAEGKAVAGAVFFAWGSTVVYKFGASDPGSWGLRPNHPIFAEAIRWACEQRYRTFDFGRTDVGNAGLRAFKQSWGAEEKELVYTSLSEVRPKPAATETPAAVSAVLRRSPAWVCRLVGETLYRYAA